MIDEAYIGEIRMFAFAELPSGYLRCDGRTIDGRRNQALAATVDHRYNTRSQVIHDGYSHPFELPDLRGRTPIHRGRYHEDGVTEDFSVGKTGGAFAVELSLANIPSHSHRLTTSEDVGTTGNMDGNLIAAVATDDLSPPNQRLLFRDVAEAGSLVALAEDSITPAGRSEPRNNIEPSFVINFCIAVQGDII